jgi:hypothetical protein
MSAAGEHPASETGDFEAARELFEGLVGWLEGGEAAGLDHAELEVELGPPP